jgi:hypothetical protein
MGCGRDARGQNSLMMRAARLSNAQLSLACLGASVAKGFAFSERIQSGKEMLRCILAMLTKLVERFDSLQYRVRESVPAVAEPFEHEDDDEDETIV